MCLLWIIVIRGVKPNFLGHQKLVVREYLSCHRGVGAISYTINLIANKEIGEFYLKG